MPDFGQSLNFILKSFEIGVHSRENGKWDILTNPKNRGVNESKSWTLEI